MNKQLASALLVAVVCGGCSDNALSSVGSVPLAPMTTSAADPSIEQIPNEYMVVLKGGSDLRAEVARVRTLGGEVMDQWQDAILGYSVRLSGSQLAALRSSPVIAWVEPNAVMHISTVYPCSAGGYANCSWGLDRISESNLPLDGNYVISNAAPSHGANTTAYIVDTGVLLTHSEFGTRARFGADFVRTPPAPGDDNGHGTHVSGILGGTNFGVAKNVQLVSVKVCAADGSCTTTDIVNGVNFVTADAAAHAPAVANMSLGGGASATVDAAVSNSIASGVVYGVAAGNNGGLDACAQSPARVPTALTVGATGSFDGLVPPLSPDERADYSDIGPCLDLFAPGSQILSAYNADDSSTAYASGTSMSTPFVVGAAALIRSERPAWSVAQVSRILVNRATTGVVTNAGPGSPNTLLNTSLPTIALQP